MDERGTAAISLVLATGLVLLLVVGIANVIVFQYGKGTARAALDEAVRAGSRSPDAVSTCETRARAMLADLLGGTMGDGVVVVCSADADRVYATAIVHFDGWFGSIADYDATITASAAMEDR